jgi:hypothetical protein
MTSTACRKQECSRRFSQDGSVRTPKSLAVSSLLKRITAPPMTTPLKRSVVSRHVQPCVQHPGTPRLSWHLSRKLPHVGARAWARSYGMSCYFDVPNCRSCRCALRYVAYTLGNDIVYSPPTESFYGISSTALRETIHRKGFLETREM